MRQALLLVAGCAFCLSQPGLAGDGPFFSVSIQFAKSNVGYSSFLHDRNACLGAASRSGWVTGDRATPITKSPTYSVSAFGDCMIARGYQPSPKGFFAAEFGHIEADRYRLVRL